MDAPDFYGKLENLLDSAVGPVSVHAKKGLLVSTK